MFMLAVAVNFLLFDQTMCRVSEIAKAGENTRKSGYSLQNRNYITMLVHES